MTVDSVPLRLQTFSLGWSSGGPSAESSGLDVGTIELRWSPTCKTNWARLSLLSNVGGGLQEVCATQDSGYRQCKGTAGSFYGTYAGVFYTGMIYSPVLRVRAHVNGGDFSSWSTGWR